MIWLVLVEAGIELVPPSLQSHPAVIADAKRRGVEPAQLLLDTNYHHSAMGALPGKQKRGRPDITHACLLCAMNTPLNILINQLRVCIHIANPQERIITVDPCTRIPRSQNRFNGLLSSLLVSDAVSDAASGAPSSLDVEGKGGEKKQALLTIERCGLRSFLSPFPRSAIHAFSCRGTEGTFSTVLKEFRLLEKWNAARGGDIVLLVGAFQAGLMSDDIMSLLDAGHLHSLAPMALDAWTVVARVVFMIEQSLSRLDQKIEER